MFYQGIDITDPYYNQPNASIYSGETTLLEDYRKRLQAMKPSGGYLGGVTAPTVEYPNLPINLEKYQQKYAAPGVSKLRTGLREAMQSARNRPLPAAGYLAGKSLEGFATGLGDVYTAAAGPAQRELGLERESMKGRYEADYLNAMNRYNLSLQQAMQQEAERASLEEMIRKMELEKYEAARMMGKPSGTTYAPSMRSLSPAKKEPTLEEMMAEIEGVMGGGGNVTTTTSGPDYYPYIPKSDYSWDYEGGPGVSEKGKSYVGNYSLSPTIKKPSLGDYSKWLQ